MEIFEWIFTKIIGDFSFIQSYSKRRWAIILLGGPYSFVGVLCIIIVDTLLFKSLNLIVLSEKAVVFMLIFVSLLFVVLWAIIGKVVYKIIECVHNHYEKKPH